MAAVLPQTINSPPHFGQSTYQQNSTPPSNNVSPSNHSSYLHARQVRQPKQPLYIPAVYRPTEISVSRQSSITPPRSANNSVDSNASNPIKFNLPSSPPLSPDEGSERSFAPWGQGSISRVVTDEWNDDALGAVTGAPTRNHWKPDSSTGTCTSPSCAQPFTFFARRHHCRRCGNIYCSSHTPHAVPLDQEARFHPEGTPQRACDSCYSDYRTWRMSRTSRTNSVTSKGSSETTTMPVGVPILRDSDEQNQQNVAGSVAQSFGYSQWSTF
ncbi:hypothetical protein AAFC00_000222 [Neodothiora populina]|uniref:FYVE-type domain-containing protein n=1 Tax=Neodothiora populina TaxID=2781224 RepID=A0ABR3P214_9PEZI